MAGNAGGPGFATLALHAGAPAPAAVAGSDQRRSGIFGDIGQAAAFFGLEGFGSDLLGGINPTLTLLEERVAALEGGTAALAVASGRSALLLCLHMLLRPGDEFIAGCGRLDGPMVERAYGNFGWGVRFADPLRPDNVERALTPCCKAIWVESFYGGRIVDIAAIAAIARKARLPLIVDNTCATPYLLRPLEHGADIVIHSAANFFGGQDSLNGGLIVDGGSFFWDERFPMLAAPRPDYGGLVFAETFGNFAFAVACRILGLNQLGPALSPVNASSMLAGLETLALRMQRHSESALQIAEYLAAHAAVRAVHYPGLPADPSHMLAEIYCPRGAGAGLTFELAGGYHAAVALIQNLKLFSTADRGPARSRAGHPASTTHRHLSDVEKEAAGAAPDLVTLSVGLEDVADLIADLDQTLAAV